MNIAIRNMNHDFDTNERGIFISDGLNMKTNTPAFNLLAGVTCSDEACKSCFKEGCYWRKICRLYKTVQSVCERNTHYVQTNLENVEAGIRYYFSEINRPAYFRIHDGGDFDVYKNIPDADRSAYFTMWLRVVKDFPAVKFMAFTKAYEAIKPYLPNWQEVIPKNFKVKWSAWPGEEIPAGIREAGIPIAWMQDKSCSETRIPENAVVCPGKCHDCGMLCWWADTDTVFHKH